MSARQPKKRKGRNVNNRERTVTTFTQDPNTSLLVPLPSEDPPAPIPAPFQQPPFVMSYQSYQHPFYHPVLPPGNSDLEILENLKNMIKDGQHEFYRAVPQPAALASLYMGQLTQDYPPHRFASSDPPNPNDQSLANTAEPQTPLSGADTSPLNIGAESTNVPDAVAKPEREDSMPQGPPDGANADAPTDHGRQPAGAASPNKPTPFDAKDDQPAGENTWDPRPLDDRNSRYDDRNRPSTYDNRPSNGDAHLPEDRRFCDRDRDRDRDWDRDRDRHDSFRDFRDRNRDRDVRERRSEFFARTYGRSHAPRPPPELRHYEPSYGDDYVPPPRRYDSEDRRAGLRSASLDDRSKPPPFDDRRPPLDDRRPPPPSADDDRRPPLDDRPVRRLSASDARTLPPAPEDRARPGPDSIPPPRAAAEDDRSACASSLAADDRPRAHVPLEERLSQPAVAAPSLQDRLSQPVPAVASARTDLATTVPSLEERLSSGPLPPRIYQRAASVARGDLRAPPPKDEPRDHDRINDFRTNRDFSRERLTASTYRPDLDRSFADRDDRNRRDRDVANIDAPPARYGDAFSRPGPPPPRRYSPPPAVFDRDRERRGYYPPRSPPPYRGDGVYDPDGDRRYATDRERDAYEQRRRDWYGPGDDDKRGPPPSWRPYDRPPLTDRDRERIDRERDRDRDRDFRERDRGDRDLIPPPPAPTRAHWDDRDRRFPLSPPPARIDAPGVSASRSLSARLTDPYPPPATDDRTYPRDVDRGRYSSVLEDHPHVPPAFSRVRNRSPSPPRRALAEDLRPVKRVREDAGPGPGPGPGYAVGYEPPRRAEPVPPPAATGVARSTGTRTPPVSASGPGFYEREREREREREYAGRGEYVGYDRDDRGRRSPVMMGRVGGPYTRMMGDRRDERRYVPPPRTS